MQGIEPRVVAGYGFRETDEATPGAAGLGDQDGVGNAVELEVELDLVNPSVDVFLQLVTAGEAEVNELEDRRFALVVARPQHVDAGVEGEAGLLVAAEFQPPESQLGSLFGHQLESRLEPFQAGPELTHGNVA